MEQNIVRLVQEKVNGYRNMPYTFSYDSSRAFYCNAIRFINSGTSNVYINDIFLLIPGSSLGIGSNQNEIDLTIYKISFRGTGTNLLQMWTKTDNGNVDYNSYPQNAFLVKDVDKRLVDAKRNGPSARKGEKDNKWGGKLRGDF